MECCWGGLFGTAPPLHGLSPLPNELTAKKKKKQHRLLLLLSYFLKKEKERYIYIHGYKSYYCKEKRVPFGLSVRGAVVAIWQRSHWRSGQAPPPFWAKERERETKKPCGSGTVTSPVVDVGPGVEPDLFSQVLAALRSCRRRHSSPHPFTRNNYPPTTYYFISSLLIFTLDNVFSFFAEIIKKIWLRKYRVICNNIFPNKNQVNVVFSKLSASKCVVVVCLDVVGGKRVVGANERTFFFSPYFYFVTRPSGLI